MASWQMQARSVECCCKEEKAHEKGILVEHMCSMLSEYHGPMQELNLGCAIMMPVKPYLTAQYWLPAELAH